MSTRYNYTGGLITEGLVLNLDAAKTGSYPGSGTTWYDISGNQNNAEMVITPSFTGISKEASFVLEGGAITATGQVDSFAIPDSVELDNMTAIGIETWMKIDQVQTPGANMIFSKRTLNTNGYVGFFTSTGYTYRIGTATPSQLSWSTTPATGAWTQNFITVGPSGGNVYQNGAPVASDPSYVGNFANAGTSADLLIGDVNPNNSTLFGFKGQIASFRMYNERISQFDVWQNFNAYKSRYGIPDIVTDGLVLNLDAGNPYSYLLGSSGTTWTDVSGNENNVTLINGSSYSNGTINFDGVDDTATAINSSDFQFGTGDFTVNYWTFINAFTGTGTPTFVDLRTTGSNGYSDYVQSNKFKLYWGTSDKYTSVASVFTNTWYNIAVTRKSSLLSVYINSSLDGTAADSTDLSGNAFRLARNVVPGNSYLNGKISSVLLYKGKALSQEEITQNFNALKGRYGIA